MKFRSLISSSLLAACLGFGISAPAQAHDDVTVWLYDWGNHHPGRFLNGYYVEHRYQKFPARSWKWHHRRGYWDDHRDRRHHDGDRYDRGHGRHDDHDGHHRR